MLKTKKAAGFKEYSLDFDGITYTIYQDSDGWIAVNSKGEMKAHAALKRDLINKLECVLKFGN
jgi:hypothetical protein